VFAEEPELAAVVQPLQFLQEAAPEQPRQHAHRQEEPGPARDPARPVWRQPAARHDAVHVRVVGQCRAPGVQHQRGADARAKVLGIGRDTQQRLGCDVEQQAVQRRLVLVRDVGDRRRQREHHVEVLHWQQIGLTRVQPALGRAALALRAVPVATRVVRDLLGAAVLAAQRMPAQCRRAAMGDGRHHLELRQAQVAALGLTPCGAVGAADVGDLQGGSPLHDGGLLLGRRRG
jgi:hypothetical protein